MTDRWYYQLLGEEFGPVSLQVLMELLESNHLTLDNYVWDSLGDTWVQLKTLLEERSSLGQSLEYADASDFDAIQLKDSASASEPAMQAASAPLEFADIADLDAIDLNSPATKIPERQVSREFADQPDPADIGLYPSDFELRDDADIEIADGDAEFKAGGEHFDPIREEKTHAPQTSLMQEWYFDCFGQVFGPVTFEELCEKVQAGEISETDVVRQGNASTFKRISDIAELRPYLPASLPPTQNSTTSSAETIPVSSLAVRKDTTPKPAPAPSSPAESPQEKRLEPLEPPSLPNHDPLPSRPQERTLQAPDPAPQPQASSAQKLAAKASAPRAKQESRWSLDFDFDKRLVVGFVLALLVLGWLYFPDLRSYKNQYQSLSALSTEFQALRTRKAPAADWDQFIQSSEATITRISEELGNESGGSQKSNMIRRYLMFAARDYWPEMVQTAREKPGQSEERFLYCLATVKNLMDDLPPPPAPADEAQNNRKGKGEGEQ